MAKLTRKILGNVNGAVGDITFADWKGRTVIKAKSEGSKADPTESQLLIREKFQVLTNLSNVFVNLIPRGLTSPDMTAYNLFRTLNSSTVTGTIGALSVDNSKIKVSRGNLPDLSTPNVSLTGQSITCNWVSEETDIATDKITLIAYCPDKNRAVGKSGALRSSGTTTLTAPATWATQLVHLYVFASNKKKSSPTMYLGSYTLS